MTLHLSEELERSIRPLVSSGRYASEEQVIEAAVREFLDRRRDQSPEPGGTWPIGAMRDAADDLDRAFGHAMKVREERPWRTAPGG